MFDPAWKKYEDGIRSDNPEIARKSVDAFEETRDFEMKNDPAARRWEEDRKKEIFANKPLAVKQRIQEEKQKYNNQLDKYLNGGIIMGKFIPSPGFVLVKPIVIDKTAQGIYLPEGTVTEDVAEPPRGVVVAVGKNKISALGVVEAPCKVGDVVAFKFHTMVMLYSGVKHHFMSFEDLFGVIEE